MTETTARPISADQIAELRSLWCATEFSVTVMNAVLKRRHGR